ncbi:hypothetical protein HDV06_001967 [Boothiomyces sp. JEL0866]|nr:hypothetical protein HDV06_001967 [Boothiomyces sp. JEL0866]
MLFRKQRIIRITVTVFTVLYLVHILRWALCQNTQTFSAPAYPIHVVPHENFQAVHSEYINQNGPLMIKRTLESDMSVIRIAIDKSLEKEFGFVQSGMCSAECQFYFSDDYAEMASKADGLITEHTDGILVDNAMLHFTKTVYQSDSGHSLRDYKWYGTDMYAGMEPIPLKHDRELYGRPGHFEAHKTFETEKSIRQFVDFKAKQDYIGVFLHPSLCGNSRNGKAVSFLQELQKNIPIQVAGGECGFKPSVSCNASETECILRGARASLIIDPYDQDSFVVPLAWKSISYSTPVIYSWSGNFTKYDPSTLFMKLEEFDSSLVMEFVNQFNQKHYNRVFRWKKRYIPDPIGRVLNNSLPNMPCVLCRHIKERKLATRAIVDLFTLSQNVSLTVKEDSLVAGKMNGVDATFVNHHSRATKRMENIKQLSRDLGTGVEVVMGFDKEDLSSEWTDLIMEDREKIGSNPARLTFDRGLYGGEISLGIKSFWVYFKILQDNLNNALVVEDDIHLNPNGRNISIADLVEKIPSTFSALHMGQCIDHYIKSLPQDGISYKGSMKITSNLGDPRHCTSAYIISKQGAILLFKSLPMAMPIDYQMSGYMPFSKNRTDYGRIEHPDLSILSLWPALFEPSVDINEMSNTGIRE